MTSIYEKIGGEPAVNAAVDIFYSKILKDEALASFFSGVNMEFQKKKQAAFLTLVMGGPNRYEGKDLTKGHAHLVKKGLTDLHVDRVVFHLKETLQELNVPSDLISQIAGVAEGARNQVLGRQAA